MSNEDVGGLEDDKIKKGAKALDKKIKDPDNRETSAEYKANSEQNKHIFYFIVIFLRLIINLLLEQYYIKKLRLLEFPINLQISLKKFIKK